MGTLLFTPTLPYFPASSKNPQLNDGTPLASELADDVQCLGTYSCLSVGAGQRGRPHPDSAVSPSAENSSITTDDISIIVNVYN